MRVRVTADMLVILSNILVLFIAKRAIEGLKGRHDFLLDSLLFGDRDLIHGDRMSIVGQNVGESYTHLATLFLVVSLAALALRFQITTLSYCHSDHLDVLRGLAETTEVRFQFEGNGFRAACMNS